MFCRRGASDSELHGLTTGMGVLFNKVADLEESVKELGSFRELVHLLSKELKNAEKSDHIASDNITKYAVPVALVLAFGYGCICAKGVSISDVLTETKCTVASGLSNMTTYFGQKSAALTEKMQQVTERLENYGKVEQQKMKQEMINRMKNEAEKTSCMKDTQVQTVCAPNQMTDQECSDRLFNLVMEEGRGFDEEALGKAFDHLNTNPIDALAFIYKHPDMRKKWLMDFAKV